jgi:hypothetical protein
MKERRVLLTEPPLNPKKNREKLMEVCSHLSVFIFVEIGNAVRHHVTIFQCRLCSSAMASRE